MVILEMYGDHPLNGDTISVERISMNFTTDTKTLSYPTLPSPSMTPELLAESIGYQSKVRGGVLGSICGATEKFC